MRCCVFASIFVTLAGTMPAHVQAEEPESGRDLPFAACYAPGTPWSVIEEKAASRSAGLGNSIRPGSGPQAYQHDDSDRWTSTATDGGGLQQGDPTTLTWSIVPDGTSIYGYAGEPTADSNLRAFLNGLYGNEATWLPIFQQVFDRWSELNGVTYVYEPNDDGSPWTQFSIASGVLGVRGDVRISGHLIDGNSGILAYNFFPNSGDMVIDTADAFYNTTSSNSLRLRNVLAHEHGHGLGLAHVCPVNQTKLMEPFASTAFDGPQHDDILASNRGYGDVYEHNDSAGTSIDLGAIVGSASETGMSIDDDFDEDWFRFTANANELLDVTVTPVGLSYLSGPQNPNGSCSPGTNFDSSSENDIGVEVLDSDGSTMLAISTLNPAGQPETIDNQYLENTGTYYVRVLPGFENAAQLYDLTIDIAPAVCSETDLELTSQTIHNSQSFTRCTIYAHSNFIVTGNGSATFNAGTTVILGNGFAIESGGFQVILDTSLIK